MSLMAKIYTKNEFYNLVDDLFQKNMAETVEPKVKPVETQVQDPKFKDFLKGLTADKSNEEPEVPKQYACILHNDRTSEGFTVRDALVEAFALEVQRATDIMMSVHRGTRGVIAIYGKDEAETRTQKAMAIVHEAGYHEFRITVEEES
jgi:ATP-dependent Clp protease adapter protein ClpS